MAKQSIYCPLAVLMTIALAGCGGAGQDNSAGQGASPALMPNSPKPATLSISTASLALAINGAPRKIIITNTGRAPASAVEYTASPSFPAGTTISPTRCGDLAPAATCVLTITPGPTPSAAAGNTSPSPILLTVSGTNTNTSRATINVLGFGSVYQSGYVFALDDMLPETTSIGGKVAALTDQAPPLPSGIVWSSNGSTGGSSDAVFDDIPGIYETSITPADACDGGVDGACNTRVIIEYYSTMRSPAINPATYAAGLCSTAIGGYSDWYLPAICEMGADSASSGHACGTTANPKRQNIQTNLVDQGDIGHLTGVYWSSTQAQNNPGTAAIAQWFQTGRGSSQPVDYKNLQLGVRCVRSITN